jgi:hypothetical protein
MKYVSIRKPEAGPFGDTFFDASVLAMVEAFSPQFCLRSRPDPTARRSRYGLFPFTYCHIAPCF